MAENLLLDAFTSHLYQTRGSSIEAIAENPLLDALRTLVDAGEEERHIMLEDLQLQGPLIRNVELYNSIRNLEINHRKYQNELKRSKSSLKGLFEFIKEKVLTRSGTECCQKNNGRNVIEMLITILNVCRDDLQKLVNAIYHNDKEASSGKTWSIVYGVLAVALLSVCVSTRNPRANIALGTLGSGSCAGAVYSYFSGSHISEKSDQLAAKVEKLRRKVEKYQTKLMVLLMHDELSSP